MRTKDIDIIVPNKLEKRAARTIDESFSEFKKNYHTSCLGRFLRNLNAYFSDITSEGVYLVQSQRPNSAFPHMNDEQSRQYVLGIFKEFIGQIESM